MLAIIAKIPTRVERSMHTMNTYNQTTNKEETHKFSWGHLLIGILFILCSLLAFYSPAANLEAFAIVFAVLAILEGIWLLFSTQFSGLRIVIGILDILVGIFMLFNINYTILALPYVFAIWFVADSIFRLATIGYTRIFGKGYFWFSLILNILGLIVGIMLLFQPLTAILTFSFLVGFYLMMFGIQNIMMAFSNP